MVMNENNMFSILKKLLSKDEINKLEETLIIEDENGYVLYGEYSIVKHAMGFKVTKFHTHLEETFYTLRNAVIWTSLDKCSKILEAKDVSNLDKMLEGTLASAELHKKLSMKTKNLENKSLYYAKLQEDRVKKRYLLSKLDQYAETVKAWQYKRYKQVTK